MEFIKKPTSERDPLVAVEVAKWVSVILPFWFCLIYFKNVKFLKQYEGKESLK